jgi:hypothetical protein
VGEGKLKRAVRAVVSDRYGKKSWIRNRQRCSIMGKYEVYFVSVFPFCEGLVGRKDI